MLAAARASITADARDLSFVEVDIVDAQGGVVPQANNKVDFTISGPGALVALDAGDSTNHDSYKGTSHAAFSGKLMAIVQSIATAAPPPRERRPVPATITCSTGVPHDRGFKTTLKPAWDDHQVFLANKYHSGQYSPL